LLVVVVVVVVVLLLLLLHLHSLQALNSFPTVTYSGGASLGGRGRLAMKRA
jgi:hypothetical protein